MMEIKACEWREINGEYWEGDCGYVFFFDTSDPEGNSFHYCPSCGKPLKQVEADEEDE